MTGGATAKPHSHLLQLLGPPLIDHQAIPAPQGRLQAVNHDALGHHGRHAPQAEPAVARGAAAHQALVGHAVQEACSAGQARRGCHA
jgi:hypothetical protein